MSLIALAVAVQLAVPKQSTPQTVGYVADFSGNVALVPMLGAKKVLQESDKAHALRLHPDDVVKSGDESEAFLVVYGRRQYVKPGGTYRVPPEDPRVGKPISGPASFGRKQGPATKLPYESLALFTYQGARPTNAKVPVPTIALTSNGELPLVWVADSKVREVRFALTIGSSTKVESTVFESRLNSLPDLPFGAGLSPELGRALIEASTNEELPVTVTLSDRSGNLPPNVTTWVLPRNSQLREQMKRSQAPAKTTSFDVFDEAVSRTESPVDLPGMRAWLVYRYWREHSDRFVSLGMLHYLAVDFRFDRLQYDLLQVLKSREVPEEGGSQ
ncbi:hypothetical protein [Fimbriimonas ginsengisoli]|uniref:Uncharacterized protein n=1 Tax=Fimbriimonas ginsengisoli Gsoil 348 TaxID=661478 RepID=A0A068NJV2_FIMGI|nr:hypothetical protein [Fimbriimonas ginsengisoli]AIE83732.1 hypothetical protein OP10G_0364 [Fimbriimonas ginsengisoli Gsoil 348]